MAEKTVWVVRHGLSEGIDRQLHQRPTDKLTEIGRRQAEAVGKRLANEPIKCIVSGSLDRQIGTADSIARYLPKAEREVTHFLDERTMPKVVEGRPWNDQECLLAMAQLREAESDSRWPIEKGETRSQLHIRAQDALWYMSYYAYQYDGDIAVVSSGGIIKMILSVILLNPWMFESWRYFDDGIDHIAHGSIQKFKLVTADGDDYWKICTINDTCHLVGV